jgi:hypothetical protein
MGPPRPNLVCNATEKEIKQSTMIPASFPLAVLSIDKMTEESSLIPSNEDASVCYRRYVSGRVDEPRFP